MTVPPTPLRVPNLRPLAPTSATLSANDKGDNEMIPRALLRSPEIYLRDEDNSARMKAVGR